MYAVVRSVPFSCFGVMPATHGERNRIHKKGITDVNERSFGRLRRVLSEGENRCGREELSGCLFY